MTQGRTLVIAHRGARKEAPENTLAAFRKAIDCGADAVELDVHVTADERLAVIHDETVERTTGAKGKVAEMTAAQLKALDAGSRFGAEFAGERIPLLEEVVALASDRLGLFVEVKHQSGKREVAARLVQEALAGFSGNATVLSFDAEFVTYYKSAYPGIPVALLSESPEGIRAARELGADAVSMSIHSPISRLGLVAAQPVGMGLYIWTITRFKDFARAMRHGPDGIITDVPRQTDAAMDGIEEAAAGEFGERVPDREEYLKWMRKFLKGKKAWPVQ